MSRQEIRTARSKKAGAKRMHNSDAADAAEEHGMHSAEDVHKVMGEVTQSKRQVATLLPREKQLREGAAREIAAIDKYLKYSTELRKQATGYLEAKQDNEKKLQQLGAEMEKKLEGKRRELTEKERAMKRASDEHTSGMQEHKTWSEK
jgi:hypothetical protein